MSDTQDVVRKGIASGAAWMISFRLVDRLMGLVSTAVLARLLTPDDFGLMALAMSMFAVLDMISELSFELALIRDQEATEEHYQTAWTARVIKGVALFTLLNVAAGPAATFFGDARLESVVHVLSLSLLFSTTQSIRITDLRKDLRFGQEFNFRIVSRLAGFFLTLGMAWFWRDYWALVWGNLLATFVRFVMSYVMMPFVPRPTLSQFADIFAFSKWLLAGNVFKALMKRSPTLVIARVADAQTLGVYAISSQICSMASTELVAPIKRALFPGYSKLVADAGSLRQIYLENFSVIVLMAMPIAAGIGLTAEFIVPLFLGSQWLGAIPVMKVMAFHAGLRTVNTNSRPLYLAMNRPRFDFILTVADVIVLLPLLAVAVPRAGAVGAAFAVVCASAVITAVDSLAVVRLLHVPWSRFVASIWRTVASIVVMALVVTELKAIMAAMGYSSDLAQLAVCGVFGTLAFVGSHLGFWFLSGKPEGSESILIRFLREGRVRLSSQRRTVSATE